MKIDIKLRKLFGRCYNGESRPDSIISYSKIEWAKYTRVEGIIQVVNIEYRHLLQIDLYIVMLQFDWKTKKESNTVTGIQK